MVNCGNCVDLTLEIALDSSRSDTLWQDGCTALNSPRDEQLCGILSKLLGNFLDGRVVDNAGFVSMPSIIHFSGDITYRGRL